MSYYYDEDKRKHYLTVYTQVSTISDIVAHIERVCSYPGQEFVHLDGDQRHAVSGGDIIKCEVISMKISGGLPKNDYGQTVEMVFDGNRNKGNPQHAGRLLTSW